MSHPIDGLEVDLSWPDGVDPGEWRDFPDPDVCENDEDVPAAAYVKSVLGFDPDSLWSS